MNDVNDIIRGYFPDDGDGIPAMFLKDLGEAIERKEEKNNEVPDSISSIIGHLRQLTAEYRCAPVAKHLRAVAEKIGADQSATREALESLAGEFEVRATYQPGQRYVVSDLADLGMVFVVGGVTRGLKMPLTLEPGDIITIHKNAPGGLEFSTDKVSPGYVGVTSRRAAGIVAAPLETE